MTVRLSVYRASWRAQIAQVAAAYPGLVPVVKGNGYGFGRSTLMSYATEIADTVAVGTIHELDAVPPHVTPVVLTPPLAPPARDDAVVTIGSREHIERLDGWTGRAVVKLASSMRRYGVLPEQLDDVCSAADRAGLELAGFGMHLPLAGTDDDRLHEIDAWLPSLPSRASVSVSHLGLAAHERLRSRRPGFEWHIRVGTALWHGDKSALRLTVDVVDAHPVRAADRVGYHHTEVPGDGTLVMVGGGTAHGITPLADGRSPFHFARRRLALVEPPHMHTSLAFVPTGDPAPGVGDTVDLQRPLIATTVDEIAWND